MDAAALWIAFVSAIGTCGAALFAGFAMVNSSKAQKAARLAAERADKAQSEALEAWRATASALENSNELSRRAARARFGNALNKIGHNMLAARISGLSGIGEYPEMSSELGALGELEFASAQKSARKLTRWVGDFTRSIDLDSTASLLEAMVLFGDRVRGWVDDPELAMSQIRVDSRLPEQIPNPTDSADWRVKD